jgi:integrase
MGRLSAIEVGRALKRRISLNDGHGLYFVSRPPNGASWMFRFSRHGKDRWMGLGQYPTVTLTDARIRADDARRLLLDDIDPIEHRRQRRAQAKLEIAKRVTFAECAGQYIASHQAGWRNPKHRQQWDSTLKTYAHPTLGGLPVAAIDTGLVVKVLQPIWTTKPETASRLRGRIESILDWATVRGFRQGDNPARWRGHLESLLPHHSKVHRVVHHAALPHAELPDFLAKLRNKDGIAPRALEFAILTAARTGEIISARWSEINLKDRLWTISPDRMKAGKEHRVPLSPRAREILEAIKPSKVDGEAFVFTGSKAEKPLSNMVFLMLLRRMNRGDLTMHGFRSTFRDWCAERTSFPNEVCEMALAHTVGSKVEAAYRRGDLFEKRRQLMAHWSDYCATNPATKVNVVSMRSKSHV